jgi:hypothetical protein
MKWIAALALANMLLLNVYAQQDTALITRDIVPVTEDTVSIPSFTVDSFISYSITTNIVDVRPQKPGTFDFIRHAPNNLWQIAKAPFQKKNLGGLAVVTAATALFLWKDHELMEHIGDVAGKINMDPTTKYHPVLRIKDVVLLKAPDNINSALYQLGDGGTSLLLAGGLFIYGKTHGDYRAIQAASDVTETVITMALATKTIKWMAGRQEPVRADGQKSSWKPFPSLKNFLEDKSNYDAFCSGHVATLTATVTVLAENFPEKKWIKPVGYSLVGMMAFALSNTRVHWVGDYPLAFALGYLSGKITAGRHKTKTGKNRVFNL